MVRSMIGEEVQPPAWLRTRTGMITSTRGDMGEHGPLRMIINGADLVTVSEEDPGDGCLAMEGGDHFSSGVILNPDMRFVGAGRVALLYENLMYVGALTNSYAESSFPRVEVGRAQSMWWTTSGLEPGWYDNEGARVDYEFNPDYIPNGAEVLPTHVVNGSRLLGQMVRLDARSRVATVIGPPVRNDRGPEMATWQLHSFIHPIPAHRSTLPPAEAPEWVDPTTDLTHGQKVVRLEERFVALTRATASLARDEDWCSNYEDASESMGLAEGDYAKEEADEPTTYEVTMSLTYSVSATNLDSVLYDQFGGNHDVRDSIDVESRVNITVTQEDGEDFDEESHDLDDILESAGYSGYDSSEVDTWRTV